MVIRGLGRVVDDGCTTVAWRLRCSDVKRGDDPSLMQNASQANARPVGREQRAFGKDSNRATPWLSSCDPCVGWNGGLGLVRSLVPLSSRGQRQLLIAGSDVDASDKGEAKKNRYKRSCVMGKGSDVMGSLVSQAWF